MPRAFSRDEDAPKNLARRRLRNLLDELHGANPLVVRDARVDERDHLVCRERTAGHDDGLRDFAGIIVRNRYDNDVGDQRMFEKQRFEFCRSHFHRDKPVATQRT